MLDIVLACTVRHTVVQRLCSLHVNSLIVRINMYVFDFLCKGHTHAYITRLHYMQVYCKTSRTFSDNLTDDNIINPLSNINETEPC